MNTFFRKFLFFKKICPGEFLLAFLLAEFGIHLLYGPQTDTPLAPTDTPLKIASGQFAGDHFVPKNKIDEQKSILYRYFQIVDGKN